MTLTEVLQNYDSAVAFFLHETEAKHRSKYTLDIYTRSLKKFRAFYADTHADDEEVKNPSYMDAQKWRDSMEAEGLATNSINTYLTVLQRFFNVCADESLEEMRFFDKNPVARRMFPDNHFQNTKPYDEILSDDDVFKLWDNTPIRKAGVKVTNWPRNYAIVMMLLSTEIRNKELLDLKVSDLDFEYGEIQIWEGKGNKYRCVDFPEIAQTAVTLYLKSGLRPDGLSDDDYLFGTTSSKECGVFDNTHDWHRGGRIWLTELVRRHVKLVTGVDNVRTHDLRHIGARLDLHSGMRAEELQAKLGHENLRTTQIYSGKLGSNRKRVTARKVYDERDRQAKRNQEMIGAV